MNLDPTYRYSASATLQKEFGSPLELAPIDDWLLHLTLRLIRHYLAADCTAHIDTLSDEGSMSSMYGIGNYAEARTDLEWAWAVLN